MRSLSHERLSPKKEKLFVILISIYLFFLGVHRGGTQFVIADISDLYALGAEGIGLFASVQHIPPLFAPLTAGIIADRIGKKPLVTAFIFVFALGCVICGFSSSLTVFIIGMFIFALGSTVSEMMSTATLSDANVEKSFQYINISQFMFSMGAVVGPLLAEFFIKNAGADWRFPFSLGFLLFVIMGAVLLFTSFPGVPARAVSSEAAGAQDKKVSGIRNIFSFVTPFILCLAIAMMIYIGMETGYGNFIDSVMRAKNATSTISAFTLSAFWGGMAISRLVFSIISYRPGRMLRLCFAGCAILLAAIIIIPGGILSIIISAGIGFAYGPIWCTIEAVAAASSEGRSGSAIGFMSIASGLGGIIIPSLIGFAAKNNVQTSLIVLAIASAVGFILCLRIKSK